MNKLLVCFICFIASFAVLTANDEADLRRIFEERYSAMKSAMAKRDGDALSALLTTDFVSTDVAGRTENASQMIDELKKLPVDNRKTTKTTIRSIKMSGNAALIEQSYDMKTTKTTADGKVQNV